ncbi:MAG: hypothetical protein V9G42_06085 [Bacteroidia bacterium]
MSDITITFSLAGDITLNGMPTTPAATEVDPTVPAHVKAITTADISSWNNKADAANLTAEQNARIAGDSNQQTYTDLAVSNLLDGVPSAGNTLNKLFNLFVGSVIEVTVADIATRDALDILLGSHVFVLDDGDNKWALYKATTAGVGANYVKLSDPDLLNAVMTAAQIKAAYESNSDTNAFTNALLAKLNGIAAGATANDTNANLRNRSTHTGTQDVSTVTNAMDKTTFKRSIKSTDQTFASTSMAAVDDLVFNVDANSEYLFSFNGRMGSSGTNGGRIGVNCPAGATIEYQVWANLGSVGTSLMAKGIDSGGAESNTVASGGTGVSSFAFFITGSIKTGATAGTVQLNARSMAGGNSFYIYAGAAVKAERIN